ncbi:MAG: bifunctional phosphopantothenoylcysteine decarboxylase/phosphopantothenate--cysteine ligase CoaBC [Pseudodesulfovibrio sp.]|uniref:Coenzyme A biosynthesis bifunctional protein CoaBC n=1 Tax=Pseudodesulfovibrio aespoeensis (strain ATCC 700646 / DSM 10631 / Aspo-2) TaxID=643562 RepID=E6VSY7_PSEA9|nr:MULTISPECIES: bifunctional phosphopantothenoylcysteine decarboxylase/phosphopantothenate--cysteine ligase CoaBC [Pseudodesulfovibrio]MBU4191889.1 bifunctional phosphopantothenoylcysteine decarboxylase/phosphopantothenate--cysteine ligase CoaBC [Pseudomonadota bacterium]ADU64329.1 phosphopantothenoylcysteine decarboxylase/phosphopantothenate/cysteine ligase [Pseudodesulfovibrio aespoeensis Aspo-2]MBU4243380.1 bifunctional phosphopantothenoylcysteine decarboxylase/phosphopantothenate--cysteine 
MQTHYRFAGFMGRRVHLGVTGSIAAFKALDLLRALLEADCIVSATLTDAATRFVTPLSFEALGASPVYRAMFDTVPGASAFGHLEPGQEADVLVIAPASANTLAKLAHGLADDMLSCQALAFPGPRIVAPAMNPRMWEAPATRRNWDMLGGLGFTLVEPEAGNVACGDTGTGRLAPLEEILTATLRAISPQDLAGKQVLVTLGPTREPWDGVRFWSNPSSGAMGACMAMAAYLRGAEVTVVAGPTGLLFPQAITVIPVRTALEMHRACLDLWPSMDIACATAAVADFRPIPHGPDKFKKGGASSLTVQFEANPDILKALGDSRRDGQQLIGFAAETGDPRAEAARKLESKGLDLIAANDVSRQGSGFGTATNEMFVLDRQGRRESWPVLPKTEVAWRLWDHLLLG